MKRTILLLFVLTACAEQREPMNDLEQSQAKWLQADYVDIYFEKKSRSVNGGAPSTEEYFAFDLYNSKAAAKVIDNERVLKNLCLQIRDSISHRLEGSDMPVNKELRVKIIERHGSGFLNQEKSRTITFPAE